MEKIAALDGWRGLAIAAVLIAHFGTSRGLNLGRMGVELFFVLSGRLMADLLFVRHHELSTFLKRRVSRVWPALYVFVLVVAGAYWIAGSEAISVASVLAALTFTANYFSIYAYQSPVFDHLWSLCIEEHTYLFLALIAFAARRGYGDPEKICLAAALLCMANGLYQTLVLNGDYVAVYWRTDVRAASILLSCYLYLRTRRANLAASTNGTLLLAVGVLGVMLNANAVPDYVKYTAGTACFAICICLIDAMPRWATSVLRSRALSWLGLLSFSLYLWQQPFAKLTAAYPRLALLLAALACAWLSYKCIENPLRTFLNSTWAAHKKRAPAARPAPDVSA